MHPVAQMSIGGPYLVMQLSNQCLQHELRGSIVTGDDVGRVFPERVDVLGTSEITNFDHPILRVQYILWFQISMNDILLKVVYFCYEYTPGP